MSTSMLDPRHASSGSHNPAEDYSRVSAWARRSSELNDGCYDPYAQVSQDAPHTTSHEKHNLNPPRSSAVTTLTIRGADIVSGPVVLYHLSQNLSTAIKELVITSYSKGPLYKLENLGHQASVYIRSQNPAAYQGFGELRLSRHLTGKWWDLKYNDGKTLVLSRKGGKDDNIEGNRGKWTKWFNNQGRVLASEENGHLTFSPQMEIDEQLQGLVLAAYTARLWRAELLAERNGLGSEALKLDGTVRANSSTRRRSINQFVGNLFSGV